MKMNRHDRRARARAQFIDGMRQLHRAALSTSVDGKTWALNLQLFTLEHALVHPDPQLLYYCMEWAQQISNNHPMCLLCQHSWTAMTADQSPPAAMVVVKPWDDRQSAVMICALCSACYFNRPALLDDIQGAMRKLWPDARFINDPHPPTTSVS